MTIATMGIDLAKNIFAVHGVDHNGKPLLVKPKVSRTALPELIANLPPCLIGMEACSGAHYWARLFRQYGHDVRLMAPKFVSPYRLAGKVGKNDAADALAICEAVQRPHMRFVPVKDEEQQSMQCLHRTRQGFIEERTASYNRLRGLLSEFGLVAPQRTEQLRYLAAEHREALPYWVRQCVADLLGHIDAIDLKITEYDRILAKIAGQDSRSKNLMKLKGIGPTTASALVASIGNAHGFRNGRQLAAWLGLTPSQYSSGGKSCLGKITKAGDSYLRTLLVQGARSVMIGVENKQDPFSRWVSSLINRRGYWCAAVAIAAKNARLCWASLNYGDDFKLYCASDT
ncbi:transposase (plasmid) [Xenorhabdus nematophila ATCC 19061]|uniref:Transposase n=1 Tax=Xenorhabdus nematophila (strain ATCC 19061 / DSM 3370 / CCUG 14189 / LMG 1036 / NCIMB 9965 / AN6) TaxID=406817 RepID=D3VM18_XENNA|nr:IS110 family transposase [Xenorhabdus nematophila]CBJ92970.1 transposase [Xenorhabdus nematophila ATCC 19061]CEK25587.1 transposase [Xenorhabdus nematophila AN6/1]